MENNKLTKPDAPLTEQSKEVWSKPEMNSISIVKTTLGGSTHFNNVDTSTEHS